MLLSHVVLNAIGQLNCLEKNGYYFLANTCLRLVSIALNSMEERKARLSILNAEPILFEGQFGFEIVIF